jgi:hypothetical protein
LCFCLFVFVLCLVYPMLTVSLYCVFCLFIFVLCLVCTGQRQTNKNTIQRYCQHWVHQTQDRDKQTKTQHRAVSGVPNVDSISVLCFWFVCLCSVSGVPNVDSIYRDKQTKNTIQRYCQHWVHQAQDKDKQTKTQHRDTVNIGYTRHRTETNRQYLFIVFFVCLSLSCVWCTQC